jgi:geranylgeranylglycerol-phosphate geranylgeranyltransferase
MMNPYVKILRPGNLFMTAAAVALGRWLGGASWSALSVLLLAAAAMCSAGYGNVINDLIDLPSDRISHPDRPLPRGLISPFSARIYAAILALTALVCAFTVSRTHGIATAVPIVLLTAYALWFKATPLAGNILISLLVAYALLFGGLRAPDFNRLLIPSVLAFLLNFCREIIKDVQDEAGDRAAGYTTTAVFSASFLKTLIFIMGTVYLLLVALPWLLHHFGTVYLVVCIAAVLPLHVVWNKRLFRTGWRMNLPAISLLIKLEMVAGLLALAIDQVWLSGW